MSLVELRKEKDYHWEDFRSILGDCIYEGSNTYLNHTIVLIEQFGGEGLGDYAWSVYKIDDSYYIKFNYPYYSYDGFQWRWESEDSVSQVIQKEVVVKEWVDE